VKTINMLDIVEAGKTFTLLARSTPNDGRHYQRRFERLRRCLKASGLDFTYEALENVKDYAKDGTLSNEVCRQIKQRLIGVDNGFLKEAAKKEVLPVVEGTFTHKLVEFAQRRLTDPQKMLVGEVEKCLQVGAFRSAVVMGWNLVYDYVRQWVFDNKLKEFNSELTSLPKSPSPIVAYSDFFRHDVTRQERKLLDLCRPNTILGGRVTESLIRHLDDRNDYAHANFLDPTVHQTNCFIENCLKVLNGPPFV
jgi:hypothetical protein